MRPDTLVFITGTGTEVGKTWVTAEVAKRLTEEGFRVAARKPVQSYDPDDPHRTDAEVLADATSDHAETVTDPSRSFPVPLAPPMAAMELGCECPTTDELARACIFRPNTEIGFVEGVGGLRSPVSASGDNLDLISQLEPDVVVTVADASLGSIHNVTSVAESLSAYRHVVFMNRFDHHDKLHGLNRAWLQNAGELVVTSIESLAATVIQQTRKAPPSYVVKLLSETSTHRVSEHRVLPGGETGWHRHAADYTVVPVATSTATILAGDGETTEFRMVVGEPYQQKAGIEHNLMNRTRHVLRFIEVESF